jgi:hypothetical protein
LPFICSFSGDYSLGGDSGNSSQASPIWQKAHEVMLLPVAPGEAASVPKRIPGIDRLEADLRAQVAQDLRRNGNSTARALRGQSPR